MGIKKSILVFNIVRYINRLSRGLRDLFIIECLFLFLLSTTNLKGNSDEILDLIAKGSDYNLSKIKAGKGKISDTGYDASGKLIQEEVVFSAFDNDDKLRWDYSITRYAIDGSKTLIYHPAVNSANFKDVDHYNDNWAIKIDPHGYGVARGELKLSEYIKAHRDNIHVQEGKLGDEDVYILEVIFSTKPNQTSTRLYVAPNKGFCIVRDESCLNDVPYYIRETTLKKYPNDTWFFDKYSITLYGGEDGKVDQSTLREKRELKVVEYELCKDVDDSLFTLEGMGATGMVTVIDRRFNDLMYKIPASADEKEIKVAIEQELEKQRKPEVTVQEKKTKVIPNKVIVVALLVLVAGLSLVVILKKRKS